MHILLHFYFVFKCISKEKACLVVECDIFHINVKMIFLKTTCYCISYDKSISQVCHFYPSEKILYRFDSPVD